MRRLLGIAVVLVALAAPVLGSAPASAQDGTPIDPLIVLIGPSISSECDAATLIVGALPVLQPSLSPALTAVLPLLGPVVSICGTVPYNPSPSVCAFDSPVQAAVVNLLLQAGVPIPVRFHPLGGAVDQVGLIEGMGVVPVQLGLAEALGATLTCTRLASGPSDQPAAATPPAPSDDTSIDLPAGPPSELAELGSIGPIGNLGASGSLAPSVDRTPRLTTASIVRRIHVSYPVAWFIPLVLLLGVIGLGHLFTRDMRDVP